MTYKQTLLNESKQCIEKLSSEIVELAKINAWILNLENINEFDLLTVKTNLKQIEEKEQIIKEFTKDLENILKMKNEI